MRQTQRQPKSKTTDSPAPAEASASAHSGHAAAPLYARGLPVQRKLTVNAPGDAYEQEAERAAEQVMRAPAASADEQPAAPVQIQRKGDGGGGHEAPPAVHETIGKPGQSLDSGDRAFMEQRFGHDFGGVQVHTDGQAAASAAAVAARAYTVGQHVVFGSGEYQPGTDAGRTLLAHELAHTLQQGGAPMLHRWSKLGEESWDVPGWGSANIPVWVSGSEAEWNTELKDMGSEDDYRADLQGFLELALDPSKVGRTRHPNGWPNYVNTIKRPISEAEIIAFMRALYGMGGTLDLSPSWYEGGSHLHSMRDNLKKFIIKYQHLILTEISTKGDASGSRVFNQKDIASLAEEGGTPVRSAMIISAIESAMEGVMTVLGGEARPSEADKSRGYQIISNAGTLIRHTLDVHADYLKASEEITLFLVDLVIDLLQLDEIPGVQALLRRKEAIKTLLKGAGKKMKSGAGMSNDPRAQAHQIAQDFENGVRQLGPTSTDPNLASALSADAEQIVINTFKSSLAVK